MPSIVIRYDLDEFRRVVQYGCIVERWDRVVGRGACGSKRRKYLAEFTPVERRTISRWHTKFHLWELVTGIPDEVLIGKPETVRLLQRAVHFFATV